MLRPPHLRLACLGLILLLATTGCDGAPTTDGTGDPPDARSVVGDTYVVGLEKAGAQGLFTVRLMGSEPIPKYTGLYVWTVEVRDGEGLTVTGASVIAEPTMPAHGHGTWPAFAEGEEMGDGLYALEEMNLFMDGVWHVAIRITGADGAEDEVAYDFDIQG